MSCGRKFLTLFFLAYTSPVMSLNCYQCSTIEQAGCFDYNLNSSHLRECPLRGGNPPICRRIIQLQHFTSTGYVTYVRECAYLYDVNNNLTCTMSKWSDIHYSQVCECNSDGCNRAVKIPRWIVWFILACWLGGLCEA